MRFCQKHPNVVVALLATIPDRFANKIECRACFLEKENQAVEDRCHGWEKHADVLNKENREMRTTIENMRRILDDQSDEILELREKVKPSDVTGPDSVPSNPVHIDPIPHNPRAEAKRAIRSIIPELEEMVDEIINATVNELRENKADS